LALCMNNESKDDNGEKEIFSHADQF